MVLEESRLGQTRQEKDVMFLCDGRIARGFFPRSPNTWRTGQAQAGENRKI
jgi:hypothetical protein